MADVDILYVRHWNGPFWRSKEYISIGSTWLKNHHLVKICIQRCSAAQSVQCSVSFLTSEILLQENDFSFQFSNREFLEGIPTSTDQFQVVAVPPVMLMPPIWVKTEPSGLTQLGFLLETQVIAVHVADIRLASCWWPYGRAVIGGKLQVFLSSIFRA